MTPLVNQGGDHVQIQKAEPFGHTLSKFGNIQLQLPFFLTIKIFHAHKAMADAMKGISHIGT